MPSVAALLSVLLPERRYPPLRGMPQHQREQTPEPLVTWLLREAERRPVPAVWEGLHWADPSTLELSAHLIDQLPAARILTMLTSRPEFRAPWAARSHLAQLTLIRLTRPQADHTVLVDGTRVLKVKELTDGHGAEAVIDFVGEGGAIEDGIAMLRRAGSYYVIGYGGTITVPTIDISRPR